MKNKSLTEYLKRYFPEQRESELVANIKTNWYLPVSAMAFFGLTADISTGYCLGLIIVMILMLVITSQISSVKDIIMQHTAGSRILCIVSALGVCLGSQAVFYEETLMFISRQFNLSASFNVFFLVISYIGAFAAVFFVFFCLLIFWKEMKRVISSTDILDSINRKEWIFYGVLLLGIIGFMTFSFARTEAFYGTELSCDIIYTSDSSYLVKDNAYLMLTNHENDIRQPLFALFSAPFIGIPYLIGRLCGDSAVIKAVLMNSVQIIMLFMGNYLLAKMMNLDLLKRVCFMLVTICTYAQLLFTLMMEQYIIVYFWLTFCMYLIVTKKQPDRIVFWGAGGTLMTNMILLPFMSDKSPVKDFKGWLLDMVKYGLEFVALLLIFCRFDVFFNLVSKISRLIDFTGESVTFSDKFYQYTEFISSCFTAPDAGANTTAFSYISWQLNNISDVNFTGIIILLVSVVSLIINHKKIAYRLAGIWVGFSAVMLLGLGWGTKENGLILYSLYFGWAFIVLLFGLIEKAENKLGIRFLTPVITACGITIMLIANIPAISEMLYFAITNYPL